jgi:hypothetical protein
MTQFIEGLDRQQPMLLPEHLDDFIDENSPVRAIDALDLAVLGFNSQPAVTGRPGYHPVSPSRPSGRSLSFKSSSSISLEIVIVLAPLRKHGPKRNCTEDRTLSNWIALPACLSRPARCCQRPAWNAL